MPHQRGVWHPCVHAFGSRWRRGGGKSRHARACVLPLLQARKVIQLGEANPTDAFEYRYDERNPFVVCNGSMLPIYRGSALVRSTYSKAAYSPEFKGKLCDIDGMSEIGGEAPGLEEAFCLDA